MLIELSQGWFGRLASLPGAYWLRDGQKVYCGALPCEESHEVDPEPGLLLSPYANEPERSFPRWVGVLPYECFRSVESSGHDARCPPLFTRVEWRRYSAAIRIERGRLDVLAERPLAGQALIEAIESACPSLRPPSLVPMGDPEGDEIHEVRVKAALERIRAGALYQVNLARRFDFHRTGTALELLKALGDDESEGPSAELGGAACAFAQELGELSVVSLSPEVFLRVMPGGQVHTMPIKGTRPRDPDPARDAQNLQDLRQSEKEKAELAMVIDLERNDLGKVSRPGSVILLEEPRTVSHRTVHHREATVSALLRSGVGRLPLLRAMMPSGSVTGAPKRAAMDTIRDLEPARRGLYTGAHGYISHSGTMQLAMAIRCLAMNGSTAHYFSGGGIVADSDPKAEVEETRWKAAQLRQLVQARFC